MKTPLPLLLAAILVSNALQAGPIFFQQNDSTKGYDFDRQAYKLLSQSKYEESIKLYDSALLYLWRAEQYETYFRCLVDKSWSYINSGQFENAIPVCEKGLLESTELNMPDSKDNFNRQFGIIYASTSDFDKSVEFFKESAKYRKERYGENHKLYSRALSALSVTYQRMGNFNESLEYSLEAIKIAEAAAENQTELINPYLNLGALYYRLTDYNKMLHFSSKALELALIKNGEKHIGTANILENMGVAFIGLGQNDKAQEYYERTLNIRKELLGEKHYKLSFTYQNLGNLYTRQNLFEKSLEAHLKSHEINIESLGEENARTLVSMRHVGIGYLNLERYSEAEKYLLKTLKLETEKYGGNHPEVTSTLTNLGILKRLEKDYQEAASYLEKSIASYRASTGEKGYDLSKAYLAYADVLEENDDYDNALIQVNNSLLANQMELAEDPFLPPSTSSFTSIEVTFKALTKKIQLFEKMDDLPNQSELVIQHVDTVSSLLQKVKKNFINQSDLLSLSNSYHSILGKGVEHSQKLYSKTKEDSFKKLLLDYSEGSKANVLVSQLLYLQARSFSGIPDSLINREVQLLKEIEDNNTSILTASNDSTQTALEEERFHLKRNYDELIELLRQEHPDFYDLKYADRKIDLNALQKYLKETSSGALILMISDDALYSSMITHEDHLISKTAFTEQFQEKIKSFRASINDVDDDGYIALSNELYDLLLSEFSPTIDKNDNLLIITDGMLSYIPFGLLASRSTGQSQFLMEKVNVRYAGSIAQVLLEKNKKNEYQSDLISFAPKFASSSLIASADVVRGELASLPGALEEVSSLNSIFSNQSYLNEDATEENFRKNSENYGIIHLATHAIIDDENPDNSRLIFSLNDSSENDGYLHAYEIYNLSLNAQLVTLSACNTGFGKIKKGEGVMSLSRAFAYAGVPATVVSLWPASDKSTPELMKFFYQNLKDGQAKDIALNNARKQYLSTATGKARHPFYWGGFVLIGDNRPLQSGSSNMIWMMLLFIAVIATATVVRKKKKGTY